ncbi:hypothetical protein [Sphaerisporangium rhizosphaerae]|uniref:Glycosyl hydrolase family 98 putative carbohydrate-binding module domain-containing protein n=1 Tax=Sphaerisporangium rhizosphaerae TaxID=2269375 RepID=A0ABW2NXE9_9ACTN
MFGIGVAVIGLVSALLTGILQYTGPGGAPAPTATVTKTETITATATITAQPVMPDTTLTPYATPSPVTGTPPADISREGDPLPSTPLDGDAVFDREKVEVNGVERKNARGALIDICDGETYEDVFGLRKKYRALKVYVAVGEDGSDTGAEVEFSFSVDGREPYTYTATFSRDPLYIEIPLISGQDKALRLSIWAKSIGCKDVNAVLISPTLVP